MKKLIATLLAAAVLTSGAATAKSIVYQYVHQTPYSAGYGSNSYCYCYSVSTSSVLAGLRHSRVVARHNNFAAAEADRAMRSSYPNTCGGCAFTTGTGTGGGGTGGVVGSSGTGLYVPPITHGGSGSSCLYGIGC